MINQQRRTLIVVCSAGLAVVWLHFYTSQTNSSSHSISAGPDIYIKNPVWTQFGPEGKPSSKLRADHLEQWPDETDAHLQEPRLTLLDKYQQPWHAKARQGRINNVQATLLLEHQVELVRESPSQDLLLHTEQLHVANDGNQLTTDQPVVLTSGSWQVSAEGFHAELNTQRLELIGNVRGIHE